MDEKVRQRQALFELREKTLGQILDETVARIPDKEAIVYADRNYRQTWREFADTVDLFAKGLMALGVQKGEKVAVWASNVPYWVTLQFATAKIGAILITVNTNYREHELEYLLNQSECENIFIMDSLRDHDYIDTLYTLAPELRYQSRDRLNFARLPHLRRVCFLGAEKHRGMYSVPEILSMSVMTDDAEYQARQDSLDPWDAINMQYTSGTTGFPKGVMLTHRNVVNDGKCIGDRMGLSTADRFMIHVPMFHCFGMTLSMTSSMTHGATMCPMPYFSAKASLHCITQEKITAFNGVPTMFIAMFNHEDYAKTDFSHMRTGIMAGAGCPPELMKRAAQPDEMNMTGIVSVYGQTESAPGSTMSAWTDPLDLRTETVGYAFPHVQCKIVDPETGAELPDGQIGEFCSRGYNIMKGYYKMPDATFATVDENGWLHSGDLAMRDERGCFVITGRLKDMIIRGGENIYPKEIEDFVITHPKVSDCQVVGVPDKKYGEEALACIILMDGETMDETEMREFMMSRIARHKVPRYIRFVDSYPMNAAGKILKYKMREAAVEELGLGK